MMRYFLAIQAFILVPFFWTLFNIAGCRITLIEFYNEWYVHLKSGESWGAFD